MQLKIIFIVLFFISCSTIKNIFFQKDEISNSIKQYKMHEESDYLEHLISIGEDYLNTPNVKLVKIDSIDQNYLIKIYNKIINNNELIFNKKISPRFYIVKDSIPFYFSLPSGMFFLSSKLISKYIVHEDILVSVLCSEIFKVHYSVYRKGLIVPVGYIQTERILSLVRLPLNLQMEINKWSFYAIKRAGYDAIAYLNWLQLQNKSALDFLFQFGGDIHRISQEEYLLKSFIVKQGISSNDTKRFERGSTKEFYRLVKKMEKIKYE